MSKIVVEAKTLDISLNELRAKQVVNIYDGKSLGHICDAIFDECYGKLLGFVVPGIKKFSSFFRATSDVFIPYQNICKIGIDVILVELIPSSSVAEMQNSNSSPPIYSSQTQTINATNYKTE